MAKIDWTPEQRENARKVHQDFFDKCQFAIDNKFYLEAIFMEYAAMEGRVKVIFSMLKTPCGMCENPSIYNRIGLQTKLGCLRNYIENGHPLFKNSVLSRSKITRMTEWCVKRNVRIHSLYTDTEKYEHITTDNRKVASKGYDYAKLLYEEVKRIRNLRKTNPELFEQCSVDCVSPKDACLEATAKNPAE